MSASPVFLSLMNNIAVVLRQRLISNGQGGFVTGYVGVGLFRARIRPASGSEQVEAMREERQITHVLYVAHGSDIRRADRVIVDDLVVEVQGIREPSKDAHHLEIDCLERQFDASMEVGS